MGKENQGMVANGNSITVYICLGNCTQTQFYAIGNAADGFPWSDGRNALRVYDQDDIDTYLSLKNTSNRR